MGDQVRSLTDTSVEDMTSSLGCNKYSREVIEAALKITRQRSEKTKTKILERYLRRLEKAQVTA